MKLVSVSGSGWRTAVASIGTSSGTSRSRITRVRDSRAWSAYVIRLSRRFCCLISPARASSVSRSPYSLIRSAAVFTPMPGTPGTLSVESPIKACTSITFDGGTPNRSSTSASPITLFFMVSYMRMPGRTSCIRSLSEDTMVTSAPACERLAGIGRDQIVGLVTLHLDAGDVERLHRVADQRKLRDEVLGQVWAVRLVAVEQIVAEGARRVIEDHREMGRRTEFAGLAQELPQHAAEAMHRADRQPVGRPRQRRQRVIGPENIPRAVDQIDVIAFCHRPAGGLFLSVSHCHDEGNIEMRGAVGGGARRLIPNAKCPGVRPRFPSLQGPRRCPAQIPGRGRRRCSRYSP